MGQNSSSQKYHPSAISPRDFEAAFQSVARSNDSPALHPSTTGVSGSQSRLNENDKHRRQISFGESAGSHSSGSGFFKRSTRRLSNVLSSGGHSNNSNHASDQRRAELLAFLQPVPANQVQRSPDSTHAQDDRGTSVGPMRPRPRGRKPSPPSSKLPEEGTQDVFMVLPATSSSAWVSPHHSPQQHQQQQFQQHQPVVTSQPQLQASLSPAEVEQERRSRIIRRPRIRSQSLPSSTPAPLHQLPNPPLEAAEETQPQLASGSGSAPAVNNDPYTGSPSGFVGTPSSSTMKRWSAARSSITPIPEGEEDEEMSSERRISGGGMGATEGQAEAMFIPAGLVAAAGGPRRSSQLYSASPTAGASDAGGSGSNSGSTSQSGGISSSAGGFSSLTPSFGRNSRDSGGTAPSIPSSDRGHAPTPLPPYLAQVLKQGLGKGWSRAEVNAAVDQAEAAQIASLSGTQRRSLDELSRATLDSDRERLIAYWETYSRPTSAGLEQRISNVTRPNSWTEASEARIQVAQGAHPVSRQRDSAYEPQDGIVISGMVGRSSMGEADGGLNILNASSGSQQYSQQRGRRDSTSSFLNLGDEAAEQIAASGGQSGSLDPRTAMTRDGQARTSYHEPYSPAAPSSVFEPTGMQSVNSLIRLDTIRASPQDTFQIVPTPAAEEQRPSSQPRSQGSGAAHSHSRSGSRHSAAASVLSGLSGDHAEVETLRRGPRATVVDPSSVATLFGETGATVPKRRGFGILGRLKGKRKDKRSNGIRYADDDFTSAGVSDITASSTRTRNAGEARDSDVTPRANKRNQDAGSLERRQLRPRSVRSTHSLKRASASSLRGKASRARDGSPSGKRLSQLLVPERGDGQVTILSPIIDLGASPAMGAWEDEEEKLRPPASPKKESGGRWPPSSWNWPKKNESDLSVNAGAFKLLRNDSVQSTNFSSSSEALGNITITYDVSATIHDADSSPNSPRFDASGRIMDQRAFSREKDRFAELNAYLAAAAAGTGSPPQAFAYEVPPPPRARRRQASGASTTESSGSNAMTATAPAETRPQERQVGEEVRVLAPPDFAPEAPSVAAVRRPSSHRSHSEPREELALPGDIAGDDSRQDADTLASLPRLPLAAHWPIAYVPGAPSDQLSSLGSDYKHRGDLSRSREASDSSTFMPGSQPVGASLDLDPIKAASAPHLGHAKRESSASTVMSAVQPAHSTVQTAGQPADGELSFESESLSQTLLRQSVARDSNSTFGRHREVPPPFSSPTFGTGPHPADAAIAQRNYRPDTRSSWLSSAGHVTSDDKRSRAQDLRKISTKPAAPKPRGRSKSDPAAPQVSDIDTSGDTLPDPVPFPESAVQASLAALHALERSGDLTHEWAFERLMGTASRSAGQEFAAARKRLELMQEEEEQLQQSRPRRRADPYRSSRLKRASEESAASSRDEPQSRRGSSRFKSHQRHLVEASGMATVSKRSFTASDSDEIIDTLRKMSQGRKSRVGEKRPRETDLSQRRPRVPSDWRHEAAEAAHSALPMIEEPSQAEGDREEAAKTKRVPTAAEWDETVVPAHKIKTTKDPSAVRPEDSPKSLRSRKLRQSPRQASKSSLPRESFPSDLQNSSFLEQVAPISTTRSHISSSGKKHRPTKQGYEQADIVAWQASLAIAQPPQ